jgi:hypothetical protein
VTLTLDLRAASRDIRPALTCSTLILVILVRCPPTSAYHPPSPPFGPLLACSALVDRFRAGQSALRVASTMHGCDAPPLQPLSLASSSGALHLPPTYHPSLPASPMLAPRRLPPKGGSKSDLLRLGRTLSCGPVGLARGLDRAWASSLACKSIRRAHHAARIPQSQWPRPDPPPRRPFPFLLPPRKGGLGTTKGGCRRRCSREPPPPPNAHYPPLAAKPRPDPPPHHSLVTLLFLILPPQRRGLSMHQRRNLPTPAPTQL